MTGLLYRLGRACARWRFVVLGLWLVLVVALVIAGREAGSETTNNVTLPGTGSQSATDLLSGRFPSQAYGSNPLVVATDSGKLTDSKYSKAIDSSVSDLKKTPHVTAAVSPLSDAGSSALSKDKQIGYISVALDVGQGSITEDEGNAVLDAANPAKKAGLQVAIGGYVGQELSKPDTGASDKIGILAAMVILLLVFGSAVAMGLPIVTAVLGLLCGLSVVTLLSHIADIPTTAPTLATMIGLAVGIDYSLFIVTKHRTQVAEGMEVHESIARATATAGGAVLFAGGTVAISLLALVVAGIPLVTTLGYTSAIAVVFAILAALTLLPALFGLLGSHVSALTLPFRKTRAGETQSPLWTRLATGIANHRWPVMIAVLVVLLALSIPTLSMRLGQEDVGAEPTDTTARQAYDLITEGFGEGTNGPFLISVQLSKPAKPDQKNLNQISQNEKKLQQQQQQIEQQALLEGATQQQAQAEAKQQTQKQSNELANKKKQAEQPATDPRLQTLRTDLQKTKGVKSVTQPLVNKQGTAAVYTLIPTTSPSDLDTEDLVSHLRDTTIPKATKGQGMTAFVGGTTAAYVDLADKITSKLPLVILVVAALSFLVLLVGIPLAPAARPGSRDEPHLGRGGLRRAHARLPGGLCLEPDRTRRRDTRRQLRAVDHVRDPVRALDRLPGLPADPDPGALQGGQGRPRDRDRGARLLGAHHRGGGAGHVLRVRQLRPERRPDDQAVRPRPGDGGRDRRARGVLLRARVDHGRRQEDDLVAPLARPDPAAHQHRGVGVLRRQSRLPAPLRHPSRNRNGVKA